MPGQLSEIESLATKPTLGNIKYQQKKLKSITFQNIKSLTHPVHQLADHPVPLVAVLLLAAIVAVVHPLEGEVELQHLGDLRDEVDGIPDDNNGLIYYQVDITLPLKCFVANQLLSRLSEHCIRRRLELESIRKSARCVSQLTFMVVTTRVLFSRLPMASDPDSVGWLRNLKPC